MNATSNLGTSDDSEIGNVKAIDILLCFVACLLTVFVCTGNILTIFAIIYTPSLRTLANIYVVSLAAADFVVGLTFILLALFLVPTTRVTIFFRFINVCVLMYGSTIGMTAVSAIHMMMISVDRYLYISRPYFYQRAISSKVVIGCVCSAWTFGIFYSILPHFIHKPYPSTPICDVTQLMPIQYLFYATASLYWTLVVVIVVMYSLILHTALKHRKAIHSAGSNGSQNGGEKLRFWERRVFRKSTVKSIKFFLTVFGVFFICLTPILICMGVDYFINIPPDIYRMCNLLALTNSGMNFIIYGVLNREFRYAFFKMLRLKPSAQGSQNPVFSNAQSIDYTATHF
ncbi:unnamed protein product [Candidula unifasciata]|uniref:G-protein coupled receptors family 1 profile domain-containing protein n=1 Tax=Candidula unifasciata TaxID=100452 RepID=A0A8S3ZVY5_9EUPU|nr:unnamed protein product [Candidula unifasciata]